MPISLCDTFPRRPLGCKSWCLFGLQCRGRNDILGSIWSAQEGRRETEGGDGNKVRNSNLTTKSTFSQKNGPWQLLQSGRVLILVRSALALDHPSPPSHHRAPKPYIPRPAILLFQSAFKKCALNYQLYCLFVSYLFLWMISNLILSVSRKVVYNIFSFKLLRLVWLSNTWSGFEMFHVY